MTTNLKNLVLLHPAGRMPDTFTGVVRTLPPEIKSWLPNLGIGSLSSQQQTAEEFLDRNELRRVILAGHGTGAQIAAAISLAQPKRVSHLVLSQPQLRVDEKELDTQLKAMKLVPKFLLRRRGIDKGELMASLEATRGLDLGESLVEAGIPILILAAHEDSGIQGSRFVPVPESATPWYEAQPERLAAEIVSLINSS
ncbi:alpha/beta fold hydrolase [Corynebacterium alimapuense]|uniref:Alpha/beta hydrolase n=1 Tax=Corynebacterium alimapuense TaxID=1576874 RepID=A0A3M8K9U2_9CORY|nr:alpha/beta hydrolase [Corynebacterium alimapuense]RNE49906.1 hypothetical protein C5L39_00580 [Corynebacterium alimapuense]